MRLFDFRFDGIQKRLLQAGTVMFVLGVVVTVLLALFPAGAFVTLVAIGLLVVGFFLLVAVFLEEVFDLYFRRLG